VFSLKNRPLTKLIGAINFLVRAIPVKNLPDPRTPASFKGYHPYNMFKDLH